MMRKLTFFIFFLLLAFVFPKSILAFPTNQQKANNNPQVVAYYPEGVHTIPGEEGGIHTGVDLVMRAGKSGNFQQWFLGDSNSEGRHGEHSLWLISHDGSCPKNFLLYVDPNPGWGDYLVDGVNYCVKTNDYYLGSH